MSKAKNILCICTAGQQRSPTAARLLREKFGFNARFAGIHSRATQPVSQEMIDWADEIIAMNENQDGHKTFLEENFTVGDTPIHVFGIPDRFLRDDPKLVSLLTEKLTTLFVE